MIILAMAILYLSGHSVAAQIIYNPNDERFRQLALEKAIWTYKDSRDEFLRAVELNAKGLLAASEFSQKQRVYKVAEIELEQALLALTQEAPHLAIEQAFSRRTSSGRRIVELKLRNMGQVPRSSQLDSLLRDVSDRVNWQALLVLRNVFVSLKDKGSIVALPYEQRIDSLRAGESISLEFQLLRELEEVEISAQFSGKVETKRVLLQKATGSSALQIAASPVAQEAMFGSVAIYELRCDRGEGDQSVFNLVLRGLPIQYQGSFFDVETGARVSKLIFSPASVSRTLQLKVHLPDRVTPLDRSDSTIQFFVGAESTEEPADVSEVALELVPIGHATLALTARNWRESGTTKEPPQLRAEIENNGSVELNDIRWEVIGPSGWHLLPNPENIDVLRLGTSVPVIIDVVTPRSEIPGEYEVSVRAFTQYNGVRVESEKKTFRVVLQTGMDISTILLSVLLAIVIIGLTIWMAKRLSRR